jgi:hypothetical protein
MYGPGDNTPNFVSSRPVVECTQCGERLFVPEWSEHVDERCVRHSWQCEPCGYSFETMFCFAPVAEPVAV